MSTSDGGGPAGTGQLTIYLEGNVVQTLPLTMPVLTIGRTPDNGLPLPDPKVSRHHAELRLTPEGTILTDLGSANGTVVQGVSIPAHQPYLLASGTVFYIGSYGFVYEAAGEAERQQRYEPSEPPVAETQLGHPDGEVGGGAPVVPQSEGVEATIGGAAETPARAAPEPAAPVVPVASITSADVERAQSRVSLPPPAPPPPPRATFPAPEPPGPLSEYLRDLPIIFQDGEFLGRFLLIFESIWEPLEHRQDHIEMYFDPATCAPSFLPWLASWLDPGLDTRWPEERLRAIVARVMDLYRWRGTRYGLGRMIELATGLTPRISEDPATPFCFRVRLEIPADGGVDQRLVENLIESHKPAHAGYVLELVPQP